MSDLTLTMPLDEWDRLIDRVKLFAEKEGMHPLLNSVHVYEANGRLYAEATDRYRIGTTVAPETVSPPKGLNMVIRLRSLVDLARVTKTPVRLRSSLLVSLTPADKGVTVEVSALPGLGDVVMTIPLETGDYPPLSKILHAALTDTSTPELSTFNPVFLADYKAVAGRHDQLTITTHGNRPALIRIGDDFLGALVPLRFTATDKPDDSPWAHFAPAETEEKTA